MNRRGRPPKSLLIKELRAATGLSLAEIAKKVYLSEDTIRDWGSGKTRPDEKGLVRLHEVSGLQLSRLVELCPGAPSLLRTALQQQATSPAPAAAAEDALTEAARRLTPVHRMIILLCVESLLTAQAATEERVTMPELAKEIADLARRAGLISEKDRESRADAG